MSNQFNKNKRVRLFFFFSFLTYLLMEYTYMSLVLKVCIYIYIYIIHNVNNSEMDKLQTNIFDKIILGTLTCVLKFILNS